MIKTIPIFLPHDRVAYVSAGPTRELPDGAKLIRCAAEIPVNEDQVAFDVSTPDFKPFDDQVLEDHLLDIIDALSEGKSFYVGCMGGTGRTGTMLALLVAQHPGMSGQMAIDYVRKIYKAGAVETADQEQQVERYASLWTFRRGEAVMAEMATQPPEPKRGLFTLPRWLWGWLERS